MQKRTGMYDRVLRNDTELSGICLYNFEFHSAHPPTNQECVAFSDGSISYMTRQ